MDDEAKQAYIILIIIGIVVLGSAIGIYKQWTENDVVVLEEPVNIRDSMQFVSGTEYKPNQAGEVAVMITNYTGSPVTANYLCNYTILYPNKTVFSRGFMDGLSDIGSQYVNFVVPRIDGIYEYGATCYSGISFFEDFTGDTLTDAWSVIGTNDLAYVRLQSGDYFLQQNHTPNSASNSIVRLKNMVGLVGDSNFAVSWEWTSTFSNLGPGRYASMSFLDSDNNTLGELIYSNHGGAVPLYPLSWRYANSTMVTLVNGTEAFCANNTGTYRIERSGDRLLFSINGENDVHLCGSGGDSFLDPSVVVSASDFDGVTEFRPMFIMDTNNNLYLNQVDNLTVSYGLSYGLSGTGESLTAAKSFHVSGNNIKAVITK